MPVSLHAFRLVFDVWVARTYFSDFEPQLEMAIRAISEKRILAPLWSRSRGCCSISGLSWIILSLFQTASSSGDPHVHIVKQVDSADEGLYTCIAGNVLGQAWIILWILFHLHSKFCHQVARIFTPKWCEWGTVHNGNMAHQQNNDLPYIQTLLHQRFQLPIRNHKCMTQNETWNITDMQCNH